MKILQHLLLTSGLALLAIAASAQTKVTNLRIQNSESPIAIEDRHPVFSWQMESDQRGQCQTAYQITVKRDPIPVTGNVQRRSAGQFGGAGSSGVTDNIMWNTGRVESGESVGITYKGIALQPEMSYIVNLTVWDKDGNAHEAESRFETGLMSPKQSAWKGARFVGSREQVLDAASQAVFDISTSFRIVKGHAASVVLGANDFRLKNAFLNGYGVQNANNYVRVTVDLGNSEPELRIYRVGYFPGDKEDEALYVVNKTTSPDNNLSAILAAGDSHSIDIHVEAGSMSLKLDGQPVMGEIRTADAGGRRRNSGGTRGTGYTISRIGTGGNYPTFPNMAEVGFAADPGSEVVFSAFKIFNAGSSEDKKVFCPHDYAVFEGVDGLSVNGKDITVSNPGDKLLVAHVDPSHGAETMVRTEFATADGKKVKSARLYATAMGIYSFYLNGQKVGKDWFAPGDSQYRETMGYFKYDVTDLVRNGRNAMGAELAGGWYAGYMTFTISNFNFFGDHTALLARLVVTYEDGTTDEIVTRPDSWKTFNDGPIRLGSFFMGERYDANKEVKGWAEPGFDDSAWQPAVEIEKREWVDFDLVARYDQPAQLRETLVAKEIMPVHNKNTYIYNMGVNMVGVPSISIPAGWLKKGDVVILSYGEQLYPGLKGDKKDYVNRFGKKGRNVAGHILFETNRAAMDTDFYVASGSEAVTIQPSKTFRGYQYIQIHIPGHDAPLPVENVKGLVISSSEIPTGRYVAQTSDPRIAPLVNQLFKNIQRSQLGNYMTIPTDCPQRNERMGWTGDAQAYARTGIYNSDVQNFNRQWMVALRNDQGIGSDIDIPGGIGSTVPTYNQYDDQSFANGTTWSAAVCMVPWQMYNQYGDKQIIEENIEAMMDWLNGMAYYRDSEKYPHLSAKASGLADWLAMDNRTPSDIVNNAIYIYMMEVTAIMADAIGRTDYAQLLRERHDLAKAEWNEAYVNPADGRTRALDGKIVNTQASYATPLNFNAFNDANKAKAEAHLAALAANPNLSGPADGSTGANYNFKPWTITTGFSGTPNILPALTRAGRNHEAYRMFTCTDYASWLYPVTKGATSVWERWGSLDNAFEEPNQNSMNSFNHFALGAVGQWMYEYQLGITADHVNGKAGYKHFVLQPTCAAPYTALEGSYHSNYGEIRSAWTADAKGVMTSFKATVPANTSATLYLPVESGVRGNSADGVRYVGIVQHLGHACAQFELPSGSYEFTINGNEITVK